ncbi:MAG: phytoene desaturase family protein [Saprospiraceae bacterium]
MEASDKSIIIIGSGIAGLAAAIDLSSKDIQVTILEKNSSHGGRARSFQDQGFQFDMGPSWYWMPDVFEDFFIKHNKSTQDYFKLIRLDPSYRIFFEAKILNSQANIQQIYNQFETLEKGSSTFLKSFLKEAKYKYEVGMRDFVRKPALSIFEFLDWRLLKSFFKLQMTKSIEAVIDDNIKHPMLRIWLKFPVLFLGAKPKDTPALYSLMNYADFVLGTWYPEGGMIKLFDALYQLALEKKVKFKFEEEVVSIDVKNNVAIKVITTKSEYNCDYVLSTADYHHTDSKLLDINYRQYSDDYWDTRIMAPSALIFYLGVKGKIDGLLHHNLFFDEDFNSHAIEIYDKKVWPEKPLFYVCMPSKTDLSIAPPGHENLFILIPLASGIEDKEEERNILFEKVIKRMEEKLNCSIKESIVFKKSYCLKDFEEDYNSFKGNAYGLSNVLSQTAFLKPTIKHKKIDNLFFAGQLTHPGPGLPPSLISGEIAASLINQSIYQ